MSYLYKLQVDDSDEPVREPEKPNDTPPEPIIEPPPEPKDPADPYPVTDPIPDPEPIPGPPEPIPEYPPDVVF